MTGFPIAITSLPPLPVAGPLACAGLLLVFGRLLPRRGPDVIAMLVAFAVAAICLVMAAHTGDTPLVYWFGGWTPRNGPAPGSVIGISFVVDQAGATIAAFIAILFFLTLLFSWGFFDEVHAHFHVLMLLFMTGMIGFCLTRDLFNLFVWFEVMSVAAFALTGFQLRTSALEGALNFTVVNTIGSYLILGGIGVIYARFGSLDMTSLGVAVTQAPNEPLTGSAFVLMATGLLIKGAQAPFHFWLSDAHAVAPSPVSVIFSGSMVALGLFGLGRVFFTVFSADPHVAHVAHTLLTAFGVTSTIVGGIMALSQRHLKRLLAFSTISHAGIMLVGLSLLSRSGVSGMLVYLVGHGLVKGSLFMVTGILLATRGGIDEIGLRGKGEGIRPAGVAMALGGLLLAGLPLGLMDEGWMRIIAAAHDAGRPWLIFVLAFGAACTGGAVLRAAGRIFLGLGPIAGEEESSPTDEEQENADRPFWLMLLPTALLLLLSLPGSHAAGQLAWQLAAPFMHPDAGAILGGTPAPAIPKGEVPEPGMAWLPWLSTALALAIATFELSRRRIPDPVTGLIDHLVKPITRGLGILHSGRVGDYVMWIMVGLALFTLTFTLI